MSNVEKTQNSNLSAVELISINVEKSKNDERGTCWEYNISEQFPIQSMNGTDEAAECIVGKPHEGYVINTSLRNSKMNGPSKIFSTKKVLVATLSFVDGVATGPCKLYDEYGNLFYEGQLENGYRHGKGKLYDDRGQIVCDAFFERGKRLDITPLKEMKGYWKECNDDKVLLRISHRDDLGKLDGICYAYDKDMISKITTWNAGKESLYTGHLKVFDEPRKVWLEGDVENGFFNGRVNVLNTSEELQSQEIYENGKKKNISIVKDEKGYWKEIDENGKTASITRKDKQGKNEGICYFYSNGKISRVSEWKEGREVSLIKRMAGSTMTMYRNGKKVYEGGFLDSFEKGYPQNGEGEEYDTDGETMVFRGHFKDGQRHGEGATYKDGVIVNRENWRNGDSECQYACGYISVFVGICCCLFLVFVATS